MRRYVILISLALLIPAPALAGAKITYSAYEGPDSIKTGEGGTRVQKNGIDYWTSGTPPKRYQIIGMITDKRDEEWDGGHAIGSPSVAEKVKKAGGSAIILVDQKEGGSTGGMGFLSGSMGWMGMGGSKTMTNMVVVKYLDQQ